MQNKIITELLSMASKEKSLVLQRFFKTGKGEYGEGDVFCGITVPNIRKYVKKIYSEICFVDLQYFLHSKYHEFRLFGLLVLIEKYEKEKIFEDKQKIIDFYISNLDYVNNWDLVDLTCYKLLGKFLYDFNLNRQLLYEFAISKNMWKRRIAIVSTMYFVKKNDFADTLKIAKILIGDKEGLLQKAVGWLLREVGKKDINILKNFMLENIKSLQNITFNYATEKFTKGEKEYFKSLKNSSNY